MESYLCWLNENERETGEEASIGLILCSEAHPEDVSLMGLDQGDIRVVRYIAENLPPPLLKKKLREIVAHHREFQARRATREEGLDEADE
ncbi:MAG: hypothetical protein OHK0029_06900 [Armatimonadaceae bacterium]